jgi:2-dehydropantoate 2-reductase
MVEQTGLKVCIAGAGAIGCTVAARLAQTGVAVSVLARGQTLDAIRRHGIQLTDLDGEHKVHVAASDNAHDLGHQDVVFVCTKAQSLPTLLPSLQPLLTPEPMVVPLINGVPWWYFHGEGGRFDGRIVQAVDPDAAISQQLSWSHILGCVVFITAQVKAPGVVSSSNPHLLIFGEPDNVLSPRLERLRAMVEKSGIEARASDRLRDSLWTKIIANLTSNPLSVVSGATLEQIYTHPGLRRIAVNILHEGLAVAAAYGARMQFDPHTFLELAAGMGAVRTSMLQDFEKGLPLELAAIGDAVLELAELMDIDMPATRDVIELARFRSMQTKETR